MKILKGTTRMTILTKKYAFKIPIINRSLKHFIKGWLGNIDESNLWKTNKVDKLCPVLFSFFGLVNIMPKVEKSNIIEFDKQYILNYFSDLNIHIDVCSGWKNFGYLNNKLVILDYANNRESGEYCSDCDHNCILKNNS